jgi:hypothetical protein
MFWDTIPYRLVVPVSEEPVASLFKAEVQILAT